jgi:hypothetical protein
MRRGVQVVARLPPCSGSGSGWGAASCAARAWTIFLVLVLQNNTRGRQGAKRPMLELNNFGPFTGKANPGRRGRVVISCPPPSSLLLRPASAFASGASWPRSCWTQRRRHRRQHRRRQGWPWRQLQRQASPPSHRSPQSSWSSPQPSGPPALVVSQSKVVRGEW